MGHSCQLLGIHCQTREGDRGAEEKTATQGIEIPTGWIVEGEEWDKGGGE